MSNFDFNSLTTPAKSQLALTLASFILHDSKMTISVENLNKVLKASQLSASEHDSSAFSSSLQSNPIDKYFSCGSGAASSATGPAQVNTKVEKKVEAKKEEVKEEEPEVDFDMGDMFG